jgi:hypothetical protein
MVGFQSCSAPPSWRSPWEAVRPGPPWGEDTAVASPAEATAASVAATAVGVFREAHRSGAAASVEDQSRTTAGHCSCSRTSTTPTSATIRTILATRTTRTATRIRPTTLLSTASGRSVGWRLTRRPNGRRSHRDAPFGETIISRLSCEPGTGGRSPPRVHFGPLRRRIRQRRCRRVSRRGSCAAPTIGGTGSACRGSGSS